MIMNTPIAVMARPITGLAVRVIMACIILAYYSRCCHEKRRMAESTRLLLAASVEIGPQMTARREPIATYRGYGARQSIGDRLRKSRAEA